MQSLHTKNPRKTKPEPEAKIEFSDAEVPAAIPKPSPEPRPKKKKSILTGEGSETAVHTALFTFYVLLGPANRSVDALCADVRRRIREGSIPESWAISPQKGLCLEEAFAWKRRAQEIDARISHKLDSVIESAAVQNIKLARQIINTDLSRIQAMQTADETFTLIKSASDLKTIIQLDHWLMQASKEMSDLEAKASAAGVPGSLAEQAVAQGGGSHHTALELLKRVKSKIDIEI